MHWLRWQAGRQLGGYDKLLLATAHWPLPFDMYLLRFREGSFIPPHTDPVTTLRHFRINIVLKKALEGGEFVCENPIFATGRVKFFRPDISKHSVTKVVKGTRYLLSIGWRA